MEKDLIVEMDKFLMDARRIAQIHGYGFGERPICWPKAEQG